MRLSRTWVGLTALFVLHVINGLHVWWPENMIAMPACYFVQFFKNHGLLSVNNRPRWRVVKGGSRRYAERLIAPFRDRLRLSCPVERVQRRRDRVQVTPCGYQSEAFDANPIGVRFDPEKLVDRYEAGDALEELVKQGSA